MVCFVLGKLHQSCFGLRELHQSTAPPPWLREGPRLQQNAKRRFVSSLNSVSCSCWLLDRMNSRLGLGSSSAESKGEFTNEYSTDPHHIHCSLIHCRIWRHSPASRAASLVPAAWLPITMSCNVHEQLLGGARVAPLS